MQCSHLSLFSTWTNKLHIEITNWLKSVCIDYLLMYFDEIHSVLFLFYLFIFDKQVFVICNKILSDVFLPVSGCWLIYFGSVKFLTNDKWLIINIPSWFVGLLIFQQDYTKTPKQISTKLRWRSRIKRQIQKCFLTLFQIFHNLFFNSFRTVAGIYESGI